MGRRLVGDQRRPELRGSRDLKDFRQELGGVALQAHGNGAVRVFKHRRRLVQVGGLLVQVPRFETHLDARGIAFDDQHRSAGHGRRERLRAAHAAEPGAQDPFSRPVAGVMLATGFGESLVGALHDALAADVDPGAGRHLPVHHQALAVELVEVLPGRPARHQVGICDQHARRVGMRFEDADRLPGLDQETLVKIQTPQGLDDAVETIPVARGLADAAVDHQVLRALRHLGVEVVHQHAQRRLGEPAPGRELRSARGLDNSHAGRINPYRG